MTHVVNAETDIVCIEDSQYSQRPEGAFLSTLVLKVYSVHADKISLVDHRYHCQIGGLALAAAAVCGSVYSQPVHDRLIQSSRSKEGLGSS